MKHGYILGGIYIVNPDVNVQSLSKKEYSQYRRFSSFKTTIFIAVRKTRDKQTVFAPLFELPSKNTVPLELCGEKYYATCCALPRAANGWMIKSDIPVIVSGDILSQIKEKNIRWQQKLNARHRRKLEEQIQREKELEKIWEDATSSPGPKDKPPSSVSWYASHPVQGGRTSPR